MKAEDLIRDPIFQLNLLIWAAKEQPLTGPGVRVTPVFHRHGYRLFYIEQPFAFPVPLQLKLQDVEDIGKAPNADVIVANNDAKAAFYIEAKKDSFGEASTNCRQARAHLLAAGPAFGEVHSPLASCRLVYSLPETCRVEMEATLTVLARDLTTRGFAPGPHSVHGLSVGRTHVVYHLDPDSQRTLGSKDSTIDLLEISADGETDPSPLLLVYTDSDTHNPADRGYYRKVLLQQVHAHLLCYFQHLDPTLIHKLTPDEILIKTTGGVLEYVGRDTRKSMCVLVRDNIFQRIVNFWQEKKPDVFRCKGNELTVQFKDEYNKEEFLNWLEDTSRTKFADTPADPAEVALVDKPVQVQSEFDLLSAPEKSEPLGSPPDSTT